MKRNLTVAGQLIKKLAHERSKLDFRRHVLEIQTEVRTMQARGMPHDEILKTLANALLMKTPVTDELRSAQGPKKA